MESYNPPSPGDLVQLDGEEHFAGSYRTSSYWHTTQRYMSKGQRLRFRYFRWRLCLLRRYGNWSYGLTNGYVGDGIWGVKGRFGDFLQHVVLSITWHVLCIGMGPRELFGDPTVLPDSFHEVFGWDL